MTTKKKAATKKAAAKKKPVAKKPVTKKPAAKVPALYFDDPEQGLAAETSHPAFVKTCVGEFFFDQGDEFAPFGGDGGNDTLRSLEDWLRGKKPGKVRAFVDYLLEDWGFTLPDLLETRASVVHEWLADPELMIYVPEIDQLLIAAAFGQLKIAGRVEPAVLELALAATAREKLVTAYGRRKNPAWSHADEKEAADTRIRKALTAMKKLASS
jgi:uncharacterized protein YfeS